MHLRSADFLDVRHHPTITVRADSVELGSGGALRGPATFEIHGQRAEVELSGHYRGGARELLVLHLSGSPDRHGFRTRPRQPVEMIVGGGWS
jgi:polyisoprenoid-binding protein YceI